MTSESVNLTDPVFRGFYHGKQKHEDDLNSVLERSRAAGVKSILITGTNLEESKRALEMAKEYDLYATVGCHPTQSKIFEKYPDGPDVFLESLDGLISANVQGRGRVVAIGECGLDYDRTHFAPPDIQKKYFRKCRQLSLAKKHGLPLFLHSRAAHEDLVSILREEGLGSNGGRDLGAKGGVVHSFTGTAEEMKELVSMGFFIGINGCSLKTEEQLKIACSIPLDRLLLETDAPWCSMTSTHASRHHLNDLPSTLKDLYFPASTRPERFQMGKPVKGRNEPMAIGAVAWTMHRLYDVPFETVTEKVFENTVELFGLSDVRH
ncbi:Mg-dependent DNase [Fistulina hepatica ATCC 64428]|uniref:Mg-dependent DNase n=1 Tax=Fistulina hepatica ATCC 64428 TaxID=1128425 RepID=A0A0D7A782_9AGAR|nr:Mg-dependent DNase [Fistulina hepatica ATCC 64428]